LTYKSLQLVVTGLVQGVGFRPFVYRIASFNALTGWVQNTNESVRMEVTGTPDQLNSFLHSLRNEAPPASLMEGISILEIEAKIFPDFKILDSHDLSEEITEISPDIAVCEACLKDISLQGNRLDYAFVNCTNCGPRFTIVQDLPYDRAKTTMKPFVMCASCKKEYETVTDRRFHAQPVACSDCGPHYELFSGGTKVSNQISDILESVSECIGAGGVVLLKGLGGMHLACDAMNESAVKKLREIKHRDGKPFAVMFRDPENLKPFVMLNEAEENSLLSWRRPIVLLEKSGHSYNQLLAGSLNAGLSLLGVMLPYMPFHHLLFGRLNTPAIVLTSGNFSSEPILIDNETALTAFSPLVDAVVLYNRAIYNRTDDSVVRIIGKRERVFRRSRGYVPSPIRTAFRTEGIVAFGAELTNCFCVGKGRKAFISQHIGDLQGLETSLFYDQTLAQFMQLFRIKPSLLAVDLHPEYISTKRGESFCGLPLIRVQHHHAHIASCMAEHQLDETVIGIALDGTGYGTDGHSWGSEFMLCDLIDFERLAHFEYVPLPGGDSAAEEPWRMAISYLYKVFGADFVNLRLPFLKQLDGEKIQLLLQMIDRKINCPLTSGAGRLFDCVASLLNLVQVATFQAEGPMRLESIVKKNCSESYSFSFQKGIISFDNMIREIVEDIVEGKDSSIVSAKFHNTIILAIFGFATDRRLKNGINKVVLSGGVFQNKYLLEGTTEILQKNNFAIYSHAAVPTNDGGIALGQLAVASKRRELKCV